MRRIAELQYHLPAGMKRSYGVVHHLTFPNQRWFPLGKHASEERVPGGLRHLHF